MTNASAFIKITPQQHQNYKWFYGKEKLRGIISVSSGSAMVEGGKSSCGSLPFQSSNSTTATAFASLQVLSACGPGVPRSVHRCPCPELRALLSQPVVQKQSVWKERCAREPARGRGARCSLCHSTLSSYMDFFLLV